MSEIDPLAVSLSARVRAMKSRLFGRERFEELLDQADLSLLIEVLLNSVYEQEMAGALTRYEGATAVEDAVSRNLVGTFRALTSAAQGRLGELARVFFQRWDLLAAKSLLRGRHHNVEGSTGQDLLVAGPGMGVALLENLARCESMEGLVQGLAMWDRDLCGGLPRALAAYAETGELAFLEETLDEGYFVATVRRLGGASDTDSGQLRRVLQMEIDRINLRTLFQLAGGPLSLEDQEDRLLPEGSLSGTTLRQMASAPSAEEAMEHLGPTAYRDLVEGLYQFLQTAQFGPMERLFELFIITYLRREARVRVLSLAVLMHYAWLKHNEVTNLRLIAQGEARHLPRGRIREEVLYA
jgi:vacuolar-type H+-ATPase subunit C/Vma6